MARIYGRWYSRSQVRTLNKFLPFVVSIVAMDGPGRREKLLREKWSHGWAPHLCPICCMQCMQRSLPLAVTFKERFRFFSSVS